MKKTKLCRYCNEQIPIDSDECPFCGEEIIEQENNISDDGTLELTGNNISNTKTSKYIIAVLFTVVLLISACASFCFIKKDALKQIFLNQTYLEQGIDLYNKNDYENAKVYFNKQINKSGDAEAYYYLGKIYEKENNEYATIYNYSNALRMNPKFDDIKTPFMELCIKSENTECINEFIKIVYEYDKNNISIAETYAKKLLEDSNNDTAAKILEEIVKKDSTNNFANYQLAKYYYEQNAIDKAYAHAVKVKIQDLEMAKVVANILIKKDYYSKAIDILDNAINKYPEDTELHDLYNLAVQKQNGYNTRIYSNTLSLNQTGNGNTRNENNDTLTNVDLGPYMRDLQRRVKNNWDPPQSNESKSIEVLFSIAKNGELLGVKILKSSGSSEADNAAISAVERTAPFKPLPSEYTKNSVDIQFTFKYNAFRVSDY